MSSSRPTTPSLAEQQGLMMSADATFTSSLSNLMDTEVSFENGAVSKFSHLNVGGGGDASAASLVVSAHGHPGQVSPGARSNADSEGSCHSSVSMDGEPQVKGRLDVKVRPTSVKRTNSNVSTAGAPGSMAVYKMDALPRGLCLIIEIEEYENNVREKRHGSKHDVANLTKLFEQLHFKVETKHNLNHRDFNLLLGDFANRQEHRSADMMVLIVLSHGSDGHVITSDSRRVATEGIYEKFNNSKCPALKGKPKFFIIQACRGEETDVGWVHEVATADEESIPIRPRKRRSHGAGPDMDTVPFHGLEEVSKSSNSWTTTFPRFNFHWSFPFWLVQYDVTPPSLQIDKARPTWEDMIIAYSTIPGYASMRDHDHGTWFVQALVEVFMTFACELELIDLLRTTSQYLSGFTNEHNEKQTCNVELRHLYKRIYFNPGDLGD